MAKGNRQKVAVLPAKVTCALCGEKVGKRHTALTEIGRCCKKHKGVVEESQKFLAGMTPKQIAAFVEKLDEAS